MVPIASGVPSTGTVLPVLLGRVEEGLQILGQVARLRDVVSVVSIEIALLRCIDDLVRCVQPIVQSRLAALDLGLALLQLVLSVGVVVGCGHG